MIPTKRPTPGEYAVIAVGSSCLFMLAGVIGLVVALRAFAEKPEAAGLLMHYAVGFLGIGLFIAFAFWMVRRIIR